MKLDIRDDLCEYYRTYMQEHWYKTDLNDCVSDLIESELRKHCVPGFELDPLTKLKTQFRLEADIRSALYDLSKSADSVFANNYLCIDIRNFKHFVDVNGRTASDEALLAIAAHLTSAYVNKNIYRFAGDEFVIDLGSENPRQLSSIDNDIILKYTTVKVYAKPNQHRTNYMVRSIYYHLEKGVIISSTEGNQLLCELTW